MSKELIRKTKYGLIEGVSEKGIDMWLGVPFAKPPVGELRFKRTRELEQWSGVNQCFKMSDGPIQYATGPMMNMTNKKHPKRED